MRKRVSGAGYSRRFDFSELLHTCEDDFDMLSDLDTSEFADMDNDEFFELCEDKYIQAMTKKLESDEY